MLCRTLVRGDDEYSFTHLLFSSELVYQPRKGVKVATIEEVDLYASENLPTTSFDHVAFERACVESFKYAFCQVTCIAVRQ